MRSIRFDTCTRLVALGLAVIASFAPARDVPAQSAAPGRGYLWLDIDGQPLPFQDKETIQEVLLTAEIVARENIERGVTGVEKLTLEHGATRFHAAFRSVDVILRQVSRAGVARPTMKYRDAAIFESAAYELSELFGLDRVPPVVKRLIGTKSGTVQIWMEDIRPEVELIHEKELHPPDVLRWKQQKKIMYVFDSLIANSDRNQGNLLIDRNWKIWFIDHTRAFKRSSKLLYRDDVTSCERHFWKALRDTDEKTISQRLEPYLDRIEITNLLSRRRKLIRHIDTLIRKKGEQAVLFNLRPPAAE